MKLQFYHYKIPFRQTFANAKKTFTHRRGLLLSLQKEGVTAWGEAAPLPGFSLEGLDDIIANISDIKEAMHALLSVPFSITDVERFMEEHDLLPALEFGLFTLCCSFLAQKEQQSLHQFLFDKKETTIPVNAVISLGQQDALKAFNTAVAEGFKTIKIKVGKDERSLLKLLENIRKIYPGIQIRIDANQSWALDQAKRLLKILGTFHIEYCEEPLAHPTPARLTELAEDSKIPLALDESLTQTIPPQIAAEIAPVIIIKPMILGITKSRRLLKQLREQTKKKVILTSSLESGLGRLMTATLTAGWGASNAAHGLATGAMLAKDLWQDDSFLQNGIFKLPNAKMLTQLMKQNLSTLPIKKLER